MTLPRAALHYAEGGRVIGPTWPRERRPLHPGGIETFTSDLETVRAWWGKSPNSNIALALGRSGLLAVCVDSPEGGSSAAWLGLLSVPTMRIETGAALYLLFQRPDFDVGSRQLAPEVSVRCDGRFILLPPSVIPGARYTWNGTRAIAKLPPMAMNILGKARPCSAPAAPGDPLAARGVR